MEQSNIPKSSSDVVIPWDSLPFIVQYIILKELATDQHHDSAEDRKHRAACAAVCREWQEFFENVNFGKLVLHQSALDTFDKIIQRRQGKVHGRGSGGTRLSKKQKLAAQNPPVGYRMPRIKHIWLRVELLEYDCPGCKRPESGKEVVRNNVVFTHALWRLLDILSTWEPEESNIDPRCGLTLELSAHSPSDSQHIFQHECGLQEDYPYLASNDIQIEYIRQYQQKSASHNGHRNYDCQFLSRGAAYMVPLLMGSRRISVAERLIRPLDLDFFGVRFKRGQSKHRLPEARVVTSLLVRRQYYRELCHSALGRLLIESLTGLRGIRYEYWRQPDDLYLHCFSCKHPLLDDSRFPRGRLASNLPPSLESLHIFEDFSTTIHGLEGASEPRPSSARVLKALAVYAPNIKHLSVSFVSDAIDCLELPHGRFPKLETVALTSQHYLHPEESRPQLNELLHKAAMAALRMPVLQIMELWNCANGHAAVFRYESTGTAESSACRLTWRSSWSCTKSLIEKGVMRAWERVASKNASRELIFEVDPLPPGSYSQYGAILGHLKLRNSILDPVSGMQVRIGTEEEDMLDVKPWKPALPNIF